MSEERYIPFMVGRIPILGKLTPPLKPNIQPKTYAYVRLFGKGDLNLQMELCYDKGIILVYPGGPSVITRSFKYESGVQKQCQSVVT